MNTQDRNLVRQLFIILVDLIEDVALVGVDDSDDVTTIIMRCRETKEEIRNS